MFSLPQETVCHIAQLLPVRSIISWFSVNRELHQSQYLWNTLVKRDYPKVDRSRLPEGKQSGILAVSHRAAEVDQVVDYS